MEMSPFKKLKFSTLQPIILFCFGLTAFGWQVFFEDSDRPYLYVLIAGMLGLPFVISADKARNGNGGEDEKSTKGSV